MNAFALTWAYLKARPGLTLLNIVLTALAVAMVVLALHIDRQAESRFAQDARGIDLVLGAKGSPLQIVLASVYHLDVPPGNIKLSDAHDVLADPRVRQGIPLSLGDSYRGSRIVGTTHNLVALYGGKLAGGKLWDAPLQAVAGADAAAKAGLALGARFTGTHGLTEGGEAHGEHPYELVGVLAKTGTVLDRLILTDLESVWVTHDHGDGGKGAPETPPASSPAAAAAALTNPAANPAAKPAEAHDHDHAHGDEREITALLVQYATPLAAATLPRELNRNPAFVAASPAYETGRLMALVGGAADALSWLAVAMAAMAAMSIFVAINASFATRAYDLALLRLLGANRVKLLVLTLLEGVTLALLGVILGLALAHLGLALIAGRVAAASHMAITAWAWHPGQWAIVIGVPLIGLLAALWPAIKAARVDVAAALSRQT
jgi:putative ABC transport system permease protein